MYESLLSSLHFLPFFSLLFALLFPSLLPSLFPSLPSTHLAAVDNIPIKQKPIRLTRKLITIKDMEHVRKLPVDVTENR